MSSKLVIPIVIIIVILAVVIFLFSNKNTPQNNNPVSNKQEASSNNAQVKDDWQSYNLDELGLTFQAPKDIDYNKEEADNSSIIITLQKGSMQENNYYQLYGVLRSNISKTEPVLENAKQELVANTIEETKVGGYKAVKGQLKGERNRFVTYIQKEGTLITLFTSQPTQENKLLTDQIISTFKFR